MADGQGIDAALRSPGAGSTCGWVLIASTPLTALSLPGNGQHLLVPMDDPQTDHRRAYGLTYWRLEAPRGTGASSC